ncbi:beta/gamma crystallin-related protein [Paenibacillus pasadenensis]|uniref:beta/gamma crystallin-related protein n=1 Tax=Paenibacillus pasadenensis TaxID=217090 RepID=UPI00203FB146|nr:beta/gamma crystallin-related protein [Paenibacillus pasadenensis]MCM3746585.1 beta/gamma crystallin-related protein [Paenibacillus pasadenensis]
MRKKKGWMLGLTMLMTVSSLAIVPPSPASADFIGSTNRNWMEQVNAVNPNFASTTLRNVILPGTHDSGTGVFDDAGFDESLAPDLINTSQIYQYVIPTGTVKSQSRTQDYNVAEQLNAGIRYLDLRVGPNQYFSGTSFQNQETTLRTMHGLYGEYMESVLQSTKNFLDANPKEIVVLDFQHFHAMSNTSYTHLKNRIEYYLGDKLVPKSYGVNTTLSTLWNENKRVIVYYGTHNYWSGATSKSSGPVPSQFMNESWVWDRSTAMRSAWMNESSAGSLKPKLDTEMNAAASYPNQLHVLQNVVTPSVGTSVSSVAGAANLLALNGLQSDWQSKGVNVVMLDFFNYNDIVNVIKRLNMKEKDSSNTEYGVYVYEHPNFQGNYNRFFGDAEIITGFRVGDDTASSVKIVGPYKVELFNDPNYSGTKTVLTSSVADLSTLGVDNVVTSLRVDKTGTDNGVFLYEHTNYVGKRTRLVADEPSMALTYVGNDSISSIQIVGNYTVQVFEHPNYQGNSYQYNVGGSASLGGWGDKISSIKVFPTTNANGVYLYQHSNYEGSFIQLTSDVSDMGATALGHDQASSIRIVGPYKAVVYEHGNYTGNSITYTSSNSSLGGWNDKASSIKVLPA